MRINSGIKATVVVHYLDLEDTRFIAGMTEKEAEWTSIRASRDVGFDGVEGRIWLTGVGKYLRKDGTVGRQDAKMVFASLSTLPEEWQQRITRDLATLAEKVHIGEYEVIA